MSDESIERQEQCRVPIKDPTPLRQGLNLRCDLTLRLDAEEGGIALLTVRVDTGAARTTISLRAAEELGIPIPGPESEAVILLGRTGGASDRVRVRHGRIRAWWGLFRTGDPFDWPVLFLVDASTNATSVLGLGGVIRDCSWHFDGRADDESPFGWATFTDVRGTEVA